MREAETLAQSGATGVSPVHGRMPPTSRQCTVGCHRRLASARSGATGVSPVHGQDAADVSPVHSRVPPTSRPCTVGCHWRLASAQSGATDVSPVHSRVPLASRQCTVGCHRRLANAQSGATGVSPVHGQDATGVSPVHGQDARGTQQPCKPYAVPLRGDRRLQQNRFHDDCQESGRVFSVGDVPLWNVGRHQGIMDGSLNYDQGWCCVKLQNSGSCTRQSADFPRSGDRGYPKTQA